MMGGQIVGGLVLALTAYLAIQGVKEFKKGVASLKFKWTYPQLEAERADDPVYFWLLSLAKLLIIGAMGYFGAGVVLSS